MGIVDTLNGVTTMGSPPAKATSASESSKLVARSVPQDGDVVVTQEPESEVRYTVRQLPATVQQFGSSSRDEAIRLARSFAQGHGVNLWYREGGTFRLLEAYRPEGTARR
jgi:hypothetical protein